MKVAKARSTLSEQRENICLQIQQNRRSLSNILTDSDHSFPRSYTLQFLTHKRLASGLMLLRLIARGLRFLWLEKHKRAHLRTQNCNWISAKTSAAE